MININNYKYILFDLDNTLYPKETGPIIEVEDNMDKYVQDLLQLPYEEAKKKRKYFFKKYGTTLSGLRKEYNIDPIEYLKSVHNIDAKKYLSEDKQLQKILGNIKSKKFILTNSYKNYALNISSALGITDFFDDIFDITDMNFESKVTENSYKTILSKIKAAAEETVMLDDVWEYLIAAKNLNIKTIFVNKENNDYANPDLHLKNIYELEKHIY